MLSAQKWQRARRIFEEVLELPLADREAFLSEKCAAIPEILEEVTRLLAAHAPGDEFLAPPGGFAGMGHPDPVEDESFRRDRIGRYRLIRIIGSGGMGSVYEAEQEHPRRRVALKTMRFGLNDPESLRRFQYETEILGRLRHPNVAQIYEAGTFPGGPGKDAQELPYFAMEYIEDALTLTEYAEREELPLVRRLSLLQQVCDGVQHAHQKGIIHRDLKPGNILVDPSGSPRIIDFGVARAERGSVDLTMQSVSGSMVGTLQTMSPEQIDIQGEVDTRSDLYSLGVILYRVVCGVYPYSLEHASLTEVARIIHHEPPRAPRSVLASIDQDLEWILLRCLEKEKERRYSTAAALKADIGRYLAHEPVEAGPPSSIYRLRKFIRRHPARTGMLLALLLGLIGTLFGLVQARKAQRTAEGEATRANTIAQFMSHLLLSPSGYREGKDSRVSDLLERAIIGLKQFDELDERIEAEVRYLLGGAFYSLTDYARSESQLRTALELYTRVLGPDDESTLETSTSLGMCLSGQGRSEEAERLLTRTVERMSRVLGPTHARTLMAEAALGEQLYHQGRLEESETLLRHSARELKQYANERALERLSTLSNLAAVLVAGERYDEADEVLSEVVDGRSQLLPEDHHSLLNAMNTRASLLKRHGQVQEARDLFAKILETRRRALPARHASTQLSLLNLAAAEQELGNLEQSELLLREAVSVLSVDHPLSEITLGATYNLASTLRGADRREEALPLYGECLRMAIAGLPEGHSRIGHMGLQLGICLVELELYPAAEPVLLQAYEQLQASRPSGDRLILKALNTIVKFYKSWGRPEDQARWQALLLEQDGG